MINKQDVGGNINRTVRLEIGTGDIYVKTSGSQGGENMTSLQTLMREIKNLKPIPAVANQLLAVVDNPDSSMEDIANVIQYDPAITASVLKTCSGIFWA